MEKVCSRESDRIKAVIGRFRERNNMTDRVKVYQVFGQEVDNILEEMNEELVI
jgi:hypothetical protein